MNKKNEKRKLGRCTLYLDKELVHNLKSIGINISKFVRNYLERLKIKIEEPDLSFDGKIVKFEDDKIEVDYENKTRKKKIS